MRKKLKKYRKEKGVAKEQMAEKLEISLNKYKKIESKKEYKINNDLSVKIKNLISKGKPLNLDKTRIVSSNIYSSHLNNTLPKSLEKTFQRFTYNSPLLDMIDKINMPFQNLGKLSESLTKQMNNYTSNYDNFKPLKGLEVLKTMENWNKTINLNPFNNDAFQGFLDEKMLNSLGYSIKSIENISNQIKTNNKFNYSSPLKDVANAISNNKTLYKDYLNFNSHLSNLISPSIERYTNILPKELHRKEAQGLEAYQTFSGSSFLAFTHFKDFDKEIEVLEKIESDPELKEQANEFFEELSQLIDDVPEENKDYDFSIFQDFYIKFSLWIQSAFLKRAEEAQMIAQTLVANYQFIIAITLTIYNAESNRIQHESTQTDLIEVKKEQVAIRERDKLILKEIRSLSKKNMIVINDAHLRISNKKSSKSLGIVKKGQIIEVLEYKIKWIRVAYEDDRTNKPMSGWVHISLLNIQE